MSLGQSTRIGQLEEKIKYKDSLIAEQIAEYIRFYNEERLHSALFYLTPKEVFEGKMEQRLEERQKKLDQAADPPAPDIGGRAGNRKNLSLFERRENSISL